MKISDPDYARFNQFALFALGFRPFFLLAGLAAFLLIGFWLLILSGIVQNNGYYPGKYWHSHEMLFGFITAVVAGFLLTAVKNWTGIQTIRHTPLALLVSVWLLGRLMPLAPVPGGLIAFVDLLFFLGLAAGIAAPILRKRQNINYVFPAIIVLMFLADSLVHLQFLGLTAATADIGINLMLYLVVTLITIMGGRVIPFFTERGVEGVTTRVWPWVEKVALAGFIIAALLDSVLPGSRIAVPFFLIAGTAHGIRLYGWYDHRIWQVPMVWILQLGYAWLILGLFLLTLVPFAWFPREFALHSLTIGGMGLVILGMMARVSLGHTARTIQADRSVQFAFMVLALSPMVRVFVPLLFGTDQYLNSLMISGALWCLAFLVFFLRYLPVLLKSRVDGLPG